MMSAVALMTDVMVLGRSERRSGNHHNQQGGEQEFSHGCILAPGLLRQHTTFGEEVRNRHQGSEHRILPHTIGNYSP